MLKPSSHAFRPAGNLDRNAHAKTIRARNCPCLRPNWCRMMYALTAMSLEDYGEQSILSATTTRDEFHPPGRVQRRGAGRNHYHHGARTPAAGRNHPPALHSLIQPLLIYVLSFTFIAIYWNNHHHLLRATRRISSGVMWANFHLLFWLSLVPVVTAWVGANGLDRRPAVTSCGSSLIAGSPTRVTSRHDGP